MSTSYLLESDGPMRVKVLLSQLATYADPGQVLRVRVGGALVEVSIADEVGKHVPRLDDEFLAKAEGAQRACQRGVGGPQALAAAHDVFADCYGLLGRFLLHARGPK